MASLEGWDIAYSSRQQFEVGVIDPDLLPSRTLVYRYYFELNPVVQGAAEASYAGFIGGLSPFGGVPTLTYAKDFVEWDLDFVVSKPTWNQLIKADASNTNGNILTLPNHVLTVGYVFKVLLDSNGDITHFVSADGSITRPVEELPERPSDTGGRDVWFQYYRSFESGGTWADYNRFQGKEGSVDQDYTLEHKPTANQTNSKRIKVKNLTLDEYYIVTYEAIEDHLFRHHVEIPFDFVLFIMGGINIHTGLYKEPPMYSAHYLWKEWTDDDDNFHEGWRVSETWRMDAPAHSLVNDDAQYDPVTNPVDGIEKRVEWAMYNMIEENLKKKDSERVGYSKNYAEYLSDQIPLSTVTPAAAALVDTDNVTPANVHRDNFLLEYVADNIVNYSGGGWPTFETGGALGVLFQVITTQYFGHITSAFYKRKFPKNTRIVPAFSRIRHGANGRVIAVKMGKGGENVSVLEDPFFFMTINGKLYFHYFHDDLGKIQLAERMSNTSNDVSYKYANDAQITGSVGGTLPGATVSPGRNLYLNNTSGNANTYNNDSNLSSSVTRYSVPPSYTSYTKEPTGAVTDVTTSYSEKPANAIKVFRVAVTTSNSVVGALELRATPADATKSSTMLRIKGESGTQEREMTGVSLPFNNTFRCDVGAWEDVDYIFIMTDEDCTLDLCDKILLNSSINRNDHLIEEVGSLAATTDYRGNFVLFYTDRGGRLDCIITPNAGHSWSRFESILMRGDTIEDLRGVPNMQENEYFLFHFYKNCLLCVPFDMSLFALPTDPAKRTEALDTIRRTACYLVWGKAIKPATDLETQRDGSGNITYEDVNDNVIFTTADEAAYQSSSRSPGAINVSPSADTSTKDFTSGNRFIKIGQLTSKNGLATTEPQSTNYAVYRSGRRSLRLFIEDEDEKGRSAYRYLISNDDGLNWSDGWRYKKASPTDKIVRINYLSDKEDTEEGTSLSLLYNETENTVYMFYFHLGAVLCKPIADEVLGMGSWDQIADIINGSPIYAVAGNLQAVVGESNYETLSPGDEKNIIFNHFQRDSNNLNKYYNEEYYNEQPISGYFTQFGYMRIFLMNSNSVVDGYINVNGIWRPEKSVLV